jgi:DNA-binding PadR family transcriptional regulator
MSVITNNIVKCFAFLTILIELANGKKMTGYQIMKHLQREFARDVSPGTLYHQLDMLASEGIIQGQRQPNNRTLYEITEDGMSVFTKFKQQCQKPLRYTYENLNSV